MIEVATIYTQRLIDFQASEITVTLQVDSKTFIQLRPA